MRHRAPWALSLVLLAGLGAVAAAQDTPSANPAKQNSNWFPNLWPFSQPAQKKTPAAAPKTQPLVVDSAALKHDREYAAYCRRREVCLNLEAIAEAKQDADLKHRVEQLWERVHETYFQRVALLPMANSLSADDQALANHLSLSDSTSQLTDGSAPRPTGNAVSQTTPREDGR